LAKTSRLAKLAAIAIAALASVAPVSAQSPAFTEFKFMSESIGWENDFAGVIDDNARTVTFTTQKWVENIAQLSAVFKLNGDYEVKAGGILQVSGVTKNDFRKDVIYRINNEVDYTITFVSPQASGLPVVKIDTKNGTPIVDKVNYVNMTFALTDTDNPSNDITVVSNTDGIRGRGNSSWAYTSKKSYRIKFDKKNSLLGLQSEKVWLLVAQFRDPTLLFNSIAFELADRFNYPYNHSSNFVELYLNGDYRGNYLLTEPNQVNPGRVDIDKDYGWFVENVHNVDEQPYFRPANYNLPVQIKSPEAEPADISNPAYDFVRRDINELCDSMASVNFPENGYRDIVNMNTFIDYLMITEIVDNREVRYAQSTFLYKNINDKINMGPLWDYDCGFGYDYDGRHYQQPTRRTVLHPFYNRFFEDPVFLVKYKERWNEKYSEVLSIGDFIDESANRIGKSAVENFKKFSNNVKTAGNFRQHVSYTKSYLATRSSYLNSVYNAVDALPSSMTFETQLFGYPNVPAQTFTLVSYGDMTDLSATLEKANSSDFEISAELVKTSTGKGGYLATIDIKPKNSLPVGTYSDRLVFSGSNQGKAFSLNVPLTFVVNEGETPAEVVFPVFSETIVYSPTRTLSDIELSGSGDGKFVWEDSAIVPSVNGDAYNVIFIPNDVVTYNYHAIPLKRLVELTVEKADPHYELPTDLTATYGDALESVMLPEGWAWETDTGVVGSVGQQTHKAVFIPFDPDNYNIIEGIELTVTVLTKISVLAPDRAIPQSKPNEEATVIAPLTILAGEFTAGPNPISKQSGIVNFYRQGKRAAACELRIYDATGNIINKVKISDKALGTQARRQVGTWDLTDKKGRPVSEGTYLVKGVIKTSDGKKEKISLILGVR
jgi:hypothetical protein